MTTHAPASAVYNTSFGVAATAPAGDRSRFSSAGACSNTGATLHDDERHRHLLGQVRPGGNANYNAAPQVTETVNAQKADQTITVTTHAPASARYNTSFTVAATAPRRPGRASRAAAPARTSAPPSR